MKQQPASPRKGMVARYVVIGVCCGAAALAVPFATNALSEWNKARERAALEERYGRVAEDPELLRRVEAIETESDAPSAPSWAGRYSMGDGSTNIALYIAPRSGAVSALSSGSGDFIAGAGIVKVRPDGSLHLAFEHPHAPVGPGEMDNVPVRWGRRGYLIRVADMPEFLHAINRNEVPLSGFGTERNYYVATGGRSGRVEGLQALSSAYPGWIRGKAATVTVLTARDGDAPRLWYGYPVCADWQATLAVDKADKLHAGEVLDAKGRDDRDTIELVLDRVDGGQATGHISRRWVCDATQPAPAAGWVFTTGAFDPKIADAVAQDQTQSAQAGKECARHWYRLWTRPDGCATEQ